MRIIDFSPGPIPIAFGAPLSSEEADYIRFKQKKALKRLIKSAGQINFGNEEHVLRLTAILKKPPQKLTEKELVVMSSSYIQQWASVYAYATTLTEINKQLPLIFENLKTTAKSIKIPLSERYDNRFKNELVKKEPSQENALKLIIEIEEMLNPKEGG